MARLVFERYRFPGEVICHAVSLYFRFTLSLRDVEGLMVQRGVDVSRETISCLRLKFAPQIARNLNRRNLPASSRWQLYEMVSTIGGERMSGEPLMTKARCWILSCRSAATRLLRFDYCAG